MQSKTRTKDSMPKLKAHQTRLDIVYYMSQTYRPLSKPSLGPSPRNLKLKAWGIGSRDGAKWGLALKLGKTVREGQRSGLTWLLNRRAQFKKIPPTNEGYNILFYPSSRPLLFRGDFFPWARKHSGHALSLPFSLSWREVLG